MTAARRFEDEVSDDPGSLEETLRREQGPRRLEAEDGPRASPARDLQSALLAELTSESATPRWPGVIRLSIIGGGSLVLWGAIIAAVKAVV